MLFRSLLRTTARTMATAAQPAAQDLSAQIAALGAQIKQLKTAGQPCESQVKELLELKTKAGLPTSSKKSKGTSLVLKTPKVSSELMCTGIIDLGYDRAERRVMLAVQSIGEGSGGRASVDGFSS